MSAQNQLESIAAKIDHAIRFFLYLLIFWLPYSNAVVESSVIIAFLLWLLKRSLLLSCERLARLSLREKIKKIISGFRPADTFLNKPIALFLFVSFLSVLGSAFWSQASHGFISKTLEWFIVYFLMIEVFKDPKDIRIALGVFIFTSLATCLDALIQFYVTHRDIFCARVIEAGSGSTAGFKTYNSLGGFLTFVVPLFFSYFIFLRAGMRRALWALALVFSLWAAATTLSRGAWVGIALGIFFILYFFGKKYRNYVVIGILAFTAVFYSSQPLPTQEKWRLNFRSLTQTSQARLMIWQDSLEMIKERPLFGHGPNTFMMLFQAYQRRSELQPTYAHNCYIQMAAEVGILGLAAFLMVLVRIFKDIQKRIKTLSSRHEAQKSLVGILGGAAAFLVHSFFDTHFYSLQLMILFWVMIGLLVSLEKRLNNEAKHVIKGT